MLVESLNDMINVSQITTTPNSRAGWLDSCSINPKYFRIMLPKEIPVIYRIVSVKANQNKLYITYEEMENFPILDVQGSVYFTNGVVGIFSKGNNHYWNNKLIVECSSESDLSSIKFGDSFTLLNQWDNKIENEELIKSLQDPQYYYNLVHTIIESNTDPSFKLEAHKQADQDLNIKDYD